MKTVPGDAPDAAPAAAPPAPPMLPPALQDGDFYLEDGRMVFTAAYHLRRGYCCGNRCRHCPYQEWNR
jgi:Family of unknown function (DUF5522)